MSQLRLGAWHHYKKKKKTNRINRWFLLILLLVAIFLITGSVYGAISYVRSGGNGDTSMTLDIGSAGTDRLVVVFLGNEGTQQPDTQVTVDGNNCILVIKAHNTVGADNHQEMWYCDEDDLGSSSSSVAIAFSNGDSGWAIHAHLYTGVSQSGPSDFGIDDTSVDTTITVTGIDVPANGLVVMGAGEGSGGMNVTSWTSPLIQRTDGPDPSSADLMTASGIESSVQTNKTYVATFSGNFNRGTGIVAVWGETDTTPPDRSNGYPYGALPSGTTQVDISLDTDENATCKYDENPGTLYDDMPNTFSTTGGISHSTTVTGLLDGNTYNYYVRCKDTLGNANTNDFPISFSVKTGYDNVWGWAWAGNDDGDRAGNGWISFNCTDRGICGSSNYGVNIGDIDIETEIGEFSGYAWAGGGEEAGADAPTLGWISFNRSETGDPPQDDPGAGSGPIAVLDYATRRVRGWMRALANGDGWDGWIKLGDSTGTWLFGGEQVKIIDTAAPHIKEFGGWAWGGDVVGWISFSCVNTDICGDSDYKVVADINFPPEAIDLDYYFLYCTDSLHPYLTWTYSDFDPEDFQTAYQIQIVSPLKLDTGEVYSDSGEYQVKVADMVTPGDDFEWDTTYSWRVKVRDNYGAWSAWSLPSTFVTPTHPYPDVDFTWSPKRPSALENISFFDDSTCYDDNIEGSPCSHPNAGGNDSFFWDFDASGLGYLVNWDWDKGDARYLEFPVVSFSYPGDWQIKLEVTDSHGIPFTCSKTRSIKVSYPLPDWKEVIPK